MNNLIENTAPESKGLVRKLALPFLLFSAVLAALLLLSWALLLPEFTHLNVGGSVKSTSDLQRYRAQLVQSIDELKRTRNDYLFPLDETEYGKLTEAKLKDQKFDFLFEQIRTTGNQLVPDTAGVVAIKSYTYNAHDKKAVIEGMIRGVGPQSMTVHAQFIEALRILPGVESAKSSRFTREEDPKIGFYSPFVIELFLK